MVSKGLNIGTDIIEYILEFLSLPQTFAMYLSAWKTEYESKHCNARDFCRTKVEV